MLEHALVETRRLITCPLMNSIHPVKGPYSFDEDGTILCADGKHVFDAGEYAKRIVKILNEE